MRHRRHRGGGERGAGAEAGRGRARAGVGPHDALAAEEGVDELRAVVAAAGEEHVFGAAAEQALERLVGLRAAHHFVSVLAAVVLVELARLVPGQAGQAQQLVAVGHQQRGLRQDQVGERGGDLLACLAQQRRGVQAGLDHQRHVRVVGEDLRDHRNVLHAAAEAELERRHRDILEHRAHLHRDQLGRDRPQLVDAAGVAHQRRGLHRQGVATHAREGQDVGREAAAGRGIARRQAQHARGSFGNGERHGRRKCSADEARADALR